MTLNPEASRRLEEAFGRRAESQARRFTFQSQQASRLASEHGLGEVIGLYAQRKQRLRAQFAGALLLIVMVFGAFALLIAAAHAGGAWAAKLFVLAVPLLLAVAISLGVRALRGGFSHAWLYACTLGFAIQESPAGRFRFIRWNAIESVYAIWESVFDFVAEESRPRLVAYALCTRQGESVEIPWSYRNMLDPYSATGRLLAALAPLEFARHIPRYDTVSELVEQRVILPLVLELRARYEAGDTLVFGAIRINEEGMSFGDELIHPWACVQKMEFKEDQFVFCLSGVARATVIRVSTIPNGPVLEWLLREIPSLARSETRRNAHHSLR